MAKRRKKKKIKYGRILILIIIISILIIIYSYRNEINTYYISKKTGYDTDIVNVFKDNSINIDILKKKKSILLEKISLTEYFNNKYADKYIDIEYHDKDNYFANINKLLDLGYCPQDINNIYDKLNDESISFILNNEYIKDLLNIINLDFFKENNLERYIKYISNNELDYETAITYVNIGLDNDYYTNIINVENQDDLLVLANKYNKLDKTYIPNDLETISSKYQWAGRGNQLRKEARIKFEEMCQKAAEDNIYIYAGSGYRSYQTQQYLYNNYVNRDGFKAAETYSARAGHSEHQTGLAMDIANKSGFISENNKEYEWLVNNSYKYGFILRYPKNKEKITGYMYEEWHYRYVGLEVATYIKEKDITFDEYLAKK